MLMFAQNGMTIAVAFLLLVIMLNMLIALLSNMYQEVVDSTEREFSKLLYTDYNENIPNDYYSSMDHNPMFLSIFMMALVPFLLFFRSKRLNTALNILIYIVKFFLPFIAVYYTLNLVLMPLAYIKILYCIVSSKYTNQV